MWLGLVELAGVLWAVPAKPHSSLSFGKGEEVGREGERGVVGREMRMSTKCLEDVVRTRVLGLC